MKNNPKTHNLLYVGEDLCVLKDLFLKLDDSVDIYHVNSPLLGFSWVRRNSASNLLIIVDSKIKGISAFEFSNIIKSRFKSAKINVALISERIQVGDIEKARENKIIEIFSKELSDRQAERMLSLVKSKKINRAHVSVATKAGQLPFWKRAFDIFCALSALTLLSPLFLLVALLIKIDSRGPVFYASKRAGRDYRVFDFYKFRTMRTGADQELEKLKKELNQYRTENTGNQAMTYACSECSKGKCTKLAIDNQIICEKQYIKMIKNGDAAFVKIKNDPRITKLGQFLRNTSIDELPQLINILKGDMSVVGNRPLPLYEAEVLTTDKGSVRFSAPAGLTGLWQVMKRGKGSMSEDERKDLDNQYAKNYNFWMDLKLIIMTLGVFIQKENV